MEQQEALHEVREIKRIMDDYRRRARSGQSWTGVGLILGVLGIFMAMPILAPVLGIGLLIGGIVGYRRSNDPLARGVSAGAIAAGALLLLMSLVVVLGLMPFMGSEVQLGEIDTIPPPAR